MLRYIFKRLGLLFLALIIILVITFFLLRLVPGLPSAVVAATKGMKTQEQVQNYLNQLGLNDGSFTAFGKYITGIFHGNFGTYYKQPSASVPTVYFHGLKYSLAITIPAWILGSILGIVFGFIAGYKRGKWEDIAINVFVVTFVAIPSFILAIALIFLGNNIGLPISFNDSLGLRYQIASLILPILTLTLTSFAVLTYYIRNEVVEVLTSDYILIARAKGVSSSGILFKHVVRNVSIPILTTLVTSFVAILAGSMIVEVFFSVPGASTIIITGVKAKEIYIVLFYVVFFGFISLLSMIIVDVLYVVIDPRIKIASAKRLTWLSMFNASRKRKKELSAKKEVING